MLFNGTDLRDTCLLYSPDKGFCGVDTFTYFSYNCGGFSDIATVTVNVKCDDDCVETTTKMTKGSGKAGKSGGQTSSFSYTSGKAGKSGGKTSSFSFTSGKAGKSGGGKSSSSPNDSASDSLAEQPQRKMTVSYV